MPCQEPKRVPINQGSKRFLLRDNGKPSARAGRKATGFHELAGLPKETCHGLARGSMTSLDTCGVHRDHVPQNRRAAGRENLDAVRTAIHRLHNQIRAKSGLPLLKENAKLARPLGHSTDMVAQGYFDHSDKFGSTFVDRILGAGYAKRIEGWSLGREPRLGYRRARHPRRVMHAWLNWPGHKANILKKAYREIGIGIRLGVPSDGGVGVTITADFGAKL